MIDIRHLLPSEEPRQNPDNTHLADTIPPSLVQSLYDLVPVGICTVDREGRFIGANEHYCRLLGYRHETLLGMHVSDVTHPDDRKRDSDARARLMSGEQLVYSVEKRYVHRDGHAFWVNVSTSTIKDRDGKPLHAIAVARDISIEKKTETALREEIARNREIMSSIDEGFLAMDQNMRVLRINEEGLRMDGRKAAEIVGRTYWDVWPGSEHLPIGQAFRKVLRARKPVSLEHSYIHGGREFWFETHAYPSGDGIVAAYRDITARKNTEKALRESEAKFRTIADAMPQMVWSTRPDGYHDYYNRQWYAYTGMPCGSTDGDQWKGMFHPADQERAWSTWRHSLSTGEPYEIQYRLRHRSGEYRWTLGRALPVRDENGSILRWMGTCTDIHDQKQAEAELMAANRRKDEFLAMLAHELRNPLAPISTAAQILRLAGADERRVRLSSDIIDRQVRHMTELVDDLLDVSRVTRGLVTLERESLDLKQVIASAIEQARPLIEAREHALNIRMDSDSAIVLGDRTRMIQVVSNLLNNAAKYTARGGEIVLSLTVQHGKASICVKDNGSGIDSALLPHIFDLFTQAKRTPDRSQGGLGLGLALVRSIMALHGGAVEAHSDGVGKGSAFTIRIPLLSAEELESRADRRLGQERRADGSAAHPNRPLSLMIVDDNLDAARSLATLLEAQGHRVAVSDDGKGALKQALGNPPRVFILDIGLPDMDGYELARRLRARPDTREATLIALTGYGQAHDRVLSKAAGFDHHFVKPMDADKLAAILSEVE